MPAPTEQRLERLIRASEAAGKTVTAALVGRDGIRLEFGEAKPASRGEAVTEADLIDWSKFR